MRSHFAAALVVSLVATIAHAQPAKTSLPPTSTPDGDQVFAGALRAYQAALAQRRLGLGELRRELVSGRVAEAEELMASGRIDEAIARLAEIVEHEQFTLFADTEEGRAALFRLGDALATAGVFEPARRYLRRLLETRGAWAEVGPAHVWPRRSVRRLVDLALETEQFAVIGRDLQSVPPTAPEEVRGEIAYMSGRAHEAAGDLDAALAAYGAVTQRCRFWAHSTYLSALIQVERGKYKEGEDLLCKIADPQRSASTTPVFADEQFFAVRDLARLGLGRIAHEQGRNDDARYYYYLVPQDSDRLSEALYEAATTRYEKKDYDGARALLNELAALGVHHRYEDEAWVLDAWVDLARCRFADADRKLVEFLKRYEPIRDGAKRIGENEVATARLLAAVHSGTDAAGAEVGGVDAETVRTISALIRVDPSYGRVLRRRAVLEREASALTGAMGTLVDMQRALGKSGGLRAATGLDEDPARKPREVRDAIEGVERQIRDLEAGRLPVERTAPLREQLSSLRARAAQSGVAAETASGPAAIASGPDLADLLRADSTSAAGLLARIANVRKELTDAESNLAKDALHRLDLRLSRLLRRARLGRIESVLGRKRALEVEVEAIRLGYLPQDAVDSLDAARYLEDSEEYWPFEGDDWPDEYVGGEVK
ncbi:MAG TPA: tetratricopeptide repeat protein [Polyangiaceae bacterium]|jgi:tetratricopeptide (TPR) repeat protein|nr:tetratricopeptide repeat protein [Polyangiaceae bacterium]